MSQQTIACWYRREPIGFPEYVPLVKRTLAIWDAFEIEYVFDSPWEDNEWERVQAHDLSGLMQEPLLRNGPLETLWPLLKAGRGYYITWYKQRAKQDFWNRLTSINIPFEIGENVYPSSPSMTIGNHDIFDAVMERYIARASFSFELSAYRTPPQLDEFQKFYFGCDAIRDLEAQLTEIWGPLGRFMYVDA